MRMRQRVKQCDSITCPERLLYALIKLIIKMSQYESEQTNIQADFDQLLQLVRQQEDYFLKIMQSVGQITNADELNQIYIHQDINRYRQILQQHNQLSLTSKEVYECLLTKYQHSKIHKGSETFLKRVIYRILQIIFNNISLINHRFPMAYQEYVKLKANCLAIMQQTNKNIPYQLIQTIIEYLLGKIQKYWELLRFLVDLLQNGSIDSISDIQVQLFLEKQPPYQLYYKKQSKKEPSFDITKINRPKFQEKEPIIQPKKKVKINRKIKALYQKVKEVVEVNKHQFMQCFGDQIQKKKDQLYKQLLLRNKINQKLIFQFQSKQGLYEARQRLQNEPINFNVSQQLINGRQKVYQRINKIRNKVKVKLVEKIIQKKPTPAQNHSLESTVQLNADQQILLNKQTTKDTQQKSLEGNIQKEMILPILLNRKAYSVDKNYSHPNSQLQLKVLSNSIKINRLQPIIISKTANINLTANNSVNSSMKTNKSTEKTIRYSKFCC